MAVTETATVAVVLVSYHTGPALFDCLEALRDEPMIAEIALVDNGNEAGARARLATWPDARVRVMSGHGNIGFAAGCHLGVDATTAPLLLLLNPDCLLVPGALLALRAALADETRPWIATPRLLEADGREQKGCRRAAGSPLNFLIEGLGLGRFFPHHRLNQYQQPLPSVLTEIPALSGAFMLMPRATWSATGGLDTGYFLHVEDLDLCARLRRIGGACWFLPAPACIHLKSTSDAPAWVVEKHKLAGLWRYFRLWYPRPWLWRALVWLALAGGIGVRLGARRR